MEQLTYNGAFDFEDGSNTGNDYAYNANGAMSKDLNKKISKIEYDLLGNPKKVTMTDSRSIEYVYAADGRRLRAVHKSGSLSEKTDYIGSLILKNGKRQMFRFLGGYYEFGEKVDTIRDCHYYITDYLGNNRMVVNASTDEVEQVNHYYAYGGIIGDLSSNEGLQEFKFGDKKLDRTYGLDLYDFEARQYDAITPWFTSIDPLAEKYYSISPYAYCAGNPVNFIDPNGCDSIFAACGLLRKLKYIGNDGKNAGDVYYVKGDVKKAVKGATKNGQDYSGDLAPGMADVAVIPRGKAAQQVENDYNNATGPELGGCKYEDGTVQSWDPGSEPTIIETKEGYQAVHSISPFYVNGEYKKLGTPKFFWHIHPKLTLTAPNGASMELGSSTPSKKDYGFEMNNNTGSTFVVGQKDRRVQYYHNSKNTISLSLRRWKRLAGL